MSNRRWLGRRALFFIAVLLFLLSAGMLWRYFAQSQRSRAVTTRAIQTAVTVSEPDVSPLPSAELPETQPAETASPDHAPALPACPISVDFDALLQENGEIIGWLYCPDTPIHYPVAQAEDNSYYLRRLLDGQWNAAGTLFLDYRSDAALSDGLSVVYGHNMKNDTMFGTLPGYRQQSYYDAHPTMFFLTPGQTYRLELLAGFAATEEDPIYSLPFSMEDGAALVETAMERSDFVSQTAPEPGDRFLALSTCLYGSQQSRYLLVGALRPIEN